MAIRIQNYLRTKSFKQRSYLTMSSFPHFFLFPFRALVLSYLYSQSQGSSGIHEVGWPMILVM